MLAITTDSDLLKSLTATLIDSANGFREAAEDVESETLRQFFNDSAAEREQVIEGLQQTTRLLCDEEEQDASLMGGAHQIWLNLRSALEGGDQEAILDEVIFGEEYLQQKFSEPLSDASIGEPARAAIRRAYEAVCDRYLKVMEVKRSLEGARS